MEKWEITEMGNENEKWAYLHQVQVMHLPRYAYCGQPLVNEVRALTQISPNFGKPELLHKTLLLELYQFLSLFIIIKRVLI